MGKILLISLKLNFTLNTEGCYGLRDTLAFESERPEYSISVCWASGGVGADAYGEGDVCSQSVSG